MSCIRVKPYYNDRSHRDLVIILTLLRKRSAFIKKMSEKCILTFRKPLYLEVNEMHLSYYKVRDMLVMNKIQIDKCHSPA